VAPWARPPCLRLFLAARVSSKAGVARFRKVRGSTVAIGMQKLVAESGSEYVTRQVAVVDPTGRGHSTLSDN